MAPPVTSHPGVEVRDFHGATSQHDEASLASGGPVVEVYDGLVLVTSESRRGKHTIKGKCVTHLMQEDMDILELKVLHEILLSNTLAPIATCTSFETIGKPQALV
jgi:hypothetical protein